MSGRPSWQPLTDDYLAAEVARRLRVATGRGAAAPRGLHAGAAAAFARRQWLVEDLRLELALAAAEPRPAEGEPAPEPAAAAPAPAGAATAAAASAEELAIARAAGADAREKLAGRIAVVREVVRPRGYGAKGFFVIARCAAAVEQELAERRRPTAGLVTGSFVDAAGYVRIAGGRGLALAPEATFCGFRSLLEAEAYWEAACGDRELLRLPRRRSR